MVEARGEEQRVGRAEGESQHPFRVLSIGALQLSGYSVPEDDTAVVASRGHVPQFLEYFQRHHLHLSDSLGLSTHSGPEADTPSPAAATTYFS